MVKIVAGQDCGMKNILVKGSWILKLHARSAAMGPCNWTLVLPLVPPYYSCGGPDEPPRGSCAVHNVAWLGNICTFYRLISSDSYSPPKERYCYIINKNFFCAWLMLTLIKPRLLGCVLWVCSLFFFFSFSRSHKKPFMRASLIAKHIWNMG